LKTFLRVTGTIIIAGVAIGAAGWVGLAIWYTFPIDATLRGIISGGYGVLMLGCLFLCLKNRRLAWLSLPVLLSFSAMLVWWSTIVPRNDRAWPDHVAKPAVAEIQGDLITVRNIRNFKYRSEADYTPRWYDKTFDLRQLDSLDLIAVYWMGDAIAHTFLSFGFGDERLAISIETRMETGEEYSALAGFFRRYELFYVVASENDLIGLRTTYRDPQEDVFIYRVTTEKQKIRKLFMQYVGKINQMNETPAFYNTAMTNCTTNIVTHVKAFNDQVPFSWKMVLTGYFPELLYDRGRLDQSLSFADLREQSLVNRQSQAADGMPEFSRLIRAGLPGSRHD
jgi:hypothetical protein